MASVMFMWLFCVFFLFYCISLGVDAKKKGEKCEDDTICEFVTKCPFALEKIKNGEFPEICGFEGISTEALVCCPDAQVPETTESGLKRIGSNENEEKVNFLEIKKKMSKAKKMCRSYVFKLCNGTFHANKSRKEDAELDPSEHPYMALIGYGDLSQVKWHCGGSLISEHYILSAAHCSYTKFGNARWARLGEMDLESDNDLHQDFEIIEHVLHPHYASPYVKNDIALFKLDKKVEFSKIIRPVCLETNSETKSADIIASGFSLTDCPSFECGQPEPAEHEHIVSVVKTEIQNGKKCKKLFENFEEIASGIDESGTLCVEYSELYTVKCQGNSGDPLIYENREVGCPLIYNQVGLLSLIGHWPHQYGCSFINSSSVYTKVSEYIPWIENIVWKNV